MNTSAELLVHSINALLELLRDPAWNGIAALVAVVLALHKLLFRLLTLLAEKLDEISLSEAKELLADVFHNDAEPHERAELVVAQPDYDAELAASFASMKELFRVHIPRLEYVPPKLRYAPLRASYRPMKLRYRPMKVGFQYGLPQVIPPRAV